MATTLQPTKDVLYQDAPATAPLGNEVHNLVHTLSKKLDAVWRYDKYIQDCKGDQACSAVFQKMKEDDLRHIQMLRDEIERRCKQGMFR